MQANHRKRHLDAQTSLKLAQRADTRCAREVFDDVLSPRSSGDRARLS
jgi:hypothetical protein